MASQLLIVCVCLALYYMFFIIARGGETIDDDAGDIDGDGGASAR
ncbi:hypothetical protein [Parapedomonas caeni]